MGEPNTPGDIYPESGCRLPLVDRENLDDEAKEKFDRLANFQDGSIVGVRGPGGLNFHSLGTRKFSLPLNRYLRFEAGFPADIREVAILAVAREMDSKFEWAAHEPWALDEGTPQEVVDAIKHRQPTDGLDEKYAMLIDLARESIGHHNVSSETFARLQKVYDSTQIVDLLTLMGNYAATAILLCAVDQQLPEGDQAELPVAD